MTHFAFSSGMRITTFVISAALVIPTAGTVGAQSPTFKSSVDLVPLTVTVTDKAGKFVSGLAGTDFTVLEDGVEQPVTFFARENVPLDVALVVDTSSSMATDLPLVQSAAIGLVHTFRPGDRGTVVEVKASTTIPQPLTDDPALVERAIRGLSTSGSTALYDGLYVVLREFERERRATAQVRRQVLVLLTDGLDTKSRLSFDDVMELARRVGVNIYVIALRPDSPYTPRAWREGSVLTAEYAMGAVSRESGGRTFYPKSATELPGIYSAIAQELASQYELGYLPAKPGVDGAFRRVMVRLSANLNALARTRSGYYAQRTKAAF